MYRSSILSEFLLQLWGRQRVNKALNFQYLLLFNISDAVRYLSILPPSTITQRCLCHYQHCTQYNRQSSCWYKYSYRVILYCSLLVWRTLPLCLLIVVKNNTWRNYISNDPLWSLSEFRIKGSCKYYVPWFRYNSPHLHI